jgi:hypothetical protein
MSRQAEWYRRNKEKILAARKAKYMADHPHPGKNKSPQIVIQEDKLEKMLNELDAQRYRMLKD